MSTQSGTFTFAVPDDQGATQIQIYACATEGGIYTLVFTDNYVYGAGQYTYAALDTTLWYKVQFYNVTTLLSGPLSDAVYGGTYSQASPFLAVSTSSDGANYATTADVYQYANLTTADVVQTKVAKALRSARAVIDFRTASMAFNRFSFFEDSIARRKYNAALRILWEAEINIALGNIYKELSDDVIIENKRNGGNGTGTISVGGTTLNNDALSERTENIQYLAALSARYTMNGFQLLSFIDTNSQFLLSRDPTELIYGPRFRFPNPGVYNYTFGGSGYAGFF